MLTIGTPFFAIGAGNAPHFLGGARFKLAFRHAFLKLRGEVSWFGSGRPDHNFKLGALLLSLVLIAHSTSSDTLVILVVAIKVAVLVLLAALVVSSVLRTCRAGTRRVPSVLISNVVPVEVRLIGVSRVVAIAKVFSPMIVIPILSRIIVMLASTNHLILCVVVVT